MNHSQITLRYAKALFDLSLESKILDKVNTDMALIDKVCSENRELRGMLQNPVISADKKQKVMEKIFFGNIQELTVRFMHILMRKHREFHIMGIASAFVDLYKEFKGIKTAYVTTVVPLTDTERSSMLSVLKELTSSDIELVENIKADILGGFVLSLDNYQLDQSLTAKIKQLRKDFDKNLYVKGF